MRMWGVRNGLGGGWGPKPDGCIPISILTVIWWTPTPTPPKSITVITTEREWALPNGV